MLLATQIIIAALVAVICTCFGFVREYYLHVWWWDIPSHFFAGMWVALCTASFYAYFRKRASIITCAMSAFGIGIAWEIFEAANGVGGSLFMPYWIDTIKDLIMDTAGGALAGFFVQRIKKL